MVVLEFFKVWCGFSLLETWCYSREWVGSPRIKLCCNISGKRNVSRVSLREFDIMDKIGELQGVYISGLMGSKSKNQIMNRRIFFRETGKYGFAFRF